MPKIKFMPSGIEVDVKNGTSILDSALDHGVSIQHACGGCCACTTCHSEVITGIENLSKIDADEEERLEIVDNRTPYSRLSCQAKVLGDVVVQIVNEE